jgi:hypothetical protein
MKWVGEQAARVKEAFGIILEDAAPVRATAQLARTPPGVTLRPHEARRSARLYEIRKDNTTLHDRETAREGTSFARTSRKGLQPRLRLHRPSRSRRTIRARYVAYLDSKRRPPRATSSPPEDAFFQNYPGTTGTAISGVFHERFPSSTLRDGRPNQTRNNRPGP